MKVKYNRIRGHRLNKYFIGVENYSGKYWWSIEKQKWVEDNELEYHGCISNINSNIKSVKAFKRHLRKWSKYMPEGTEFVFVSRYVGYDVIGVI